MLFRVDECSYAACNAIWISVAYLELMQRNLAGANMGGTSVV